MPFFINDNVEIAVKCKSDGIHVGQEDMVADQVPQKVGEDMMIGVSVHSVEEALEAVKNGADYLGVGAMFSTSTKMDVGVLSKKVLKDICDAADILADLKTMSMNGVYAMSVITALTAQNTTGVRAV